MIIKTETQIIRSLETSWIEAHPEIEQKNKPLYVFIHGYPDDATLWNPLINHFAQSHICIAPFLRGTGGSARSKSKSRYSMSSCALDILEILSRLDPSHKFPIHVVGHDIGSIVAWELARTLGSQLNALTIINGVSIEQMSRRVLRPSQLLKSWYILFAQLPLSKDPMVEHYRQSFKIALKNRFFLNESKNSIASKLILAPTLIIHSAEDPYLDPPSKSEINLLAKNNTIRIIEGDHWLQRSQPERIIKLLENS